MEITYHISTNDDKKRVSESSDESESVRDESYGNEENVMKKRSQHTLDSMYKDINGSHVKLCCAETVECTPRQMTDIESTSVREGYENSRSLVQETNVWRRYIMSKFYIWGSKNCVERR